MTPENEKYIIDNYHKEKTIDILKRLNISKTALLRIVKKHDLKKKSSKKYNFDEDFFKTIDNENKAYWLGFFYADGYVRDRKNSSETRLKLGIKDLDHLEKFKITLGANNEIQIKEKLAILSLNTRKFTRNLIDRGCHQRKTFTIKFPNFLDEKLIRHFIRGYFDGDGSISESKKRKWNGDVHPTKKQNVVNFVSGSDDMLNSLGEIISENCKTKPRKIYKYNDNKFGYIAWFTNEDIEKIYHYFYDESSVYLLRKKKEFEKIINNYVGIR